MFYIFMKITFFLSKKREGRGLEDIVLMGFVRGNELGCREKK